MTASNFIKKRLFTWVTGIKQQDFDGLMVQACKMAQSSKDKPGTRKYFQSLMFIAQPKLAQLYFGEGAFVADGRKNV